MTVGVKDAFVGGSLTMEVDTTWSSSSAKNAYDGDTVSLAGLNRSFDDYDGGGFGALIGTSGNDALIYDTTGSAKDSDPAHFVGILNIDLGAGDDVIDLTSGAGGAASYLKYGLYVVGGVGDDVAWAGGGNEVLFGDARTFFGNSVGGNDILHGGAGPDTIYGDAESMGPSSTGGNDVVDGGTGNDTIYGDALNISSGATRGHNTFRFDGPGSGADQIGDYADNGFRHGLDHIRLKASYGYTAADALAHTSDVGGRAVVDLGHGDSITLAGVTTSQLDASDFVIA